MYPICTLLFNEDKMLFHVTVPYEDMIIYFEYIISIGN